MKKISFVTGCYNEEDNVELLYEKIKEQMLQYKDKYEWELLYIDNCSTDSTVYNIRKLANKDNRVKAIVNSRNFGWVRSHFYGFINTFGDATITLCTDLQDPPELIPQFIKKWEDGYKMVLGQKNKSRENFIIYLFRELFYKIMKLVTDDNTEQLRQCTGFGLYDKSIVDIIRQIDDPYPYFRGLICDVGFEKALIDYVQPKRQTGFSKNKFYSLYDFAMLGIIKHSKVPLRIATFSGFILSLISLLVGLFYFIYKLVFWNSFDVGIAPLVIGLFVFASIQLFVLGLVGEYVGAIYTRVDKKPLVLEKERINC